MLDQLQGNISDVLRVIFVSIRCSAGRHVYAADRLHLLDKYNAIC